MSEPESVSHPFPAVKFLWLFSVSEQNTFSPTNKEITPKQGESHQIGFVLNQKAISSADKVVGKLSVNFHNLYQIAHQQNTF